MVSMHIYNSSCYCIKERSHFPNNIEYKFYVSFEDALWDLLEHLKFPKNSVILVPTFYCIDVENDIKDHGYKIEHYKVKEDLTVDITDFKNAVKKYDPKVVIVLHIQGIESNLLKLIDSSKYLVIEDSVHKLFNPPEVKITSQNHYIITSLRKTTPFTGSFIIGKSGTLTWMQKNTLTTLIYAYFSLFLHNTFQILLSIGYRFEMRILIIIAEKVLVLHNNLIGNSKRAGSISEKYKNNYFRVNFEELYVKKTQQVELYNKLLSKLPYYIILPNINVSNYKYLRGYILIIDEKFSKDFLNHLRSNMIFCDYQLKDCSWSKNNKLLLLPIGLHVKNTSIEELCSVIMKFKVNS